MNKILRRLNNIFEAEGKTFPEFFELDPAVWQRIQQYAKSKDYTLTDTELRTASGQTLVTINSEDSWNQILTLLELEDLKNVPIRKVNINSFSKMKAYPSSTQYKVKIQGDIGDQELPSEDEVKEILTANLVQVKGKIQGEPQITKQDSTVAINFNVVTNAAEDDVKQAIQMNFDKVVRIKNIDVQKI